MELAGKGQNIILVSRTLSKLETVAKEIEEKYRVQTKIVDIDFSTEARVQERIEEAIKVYMWQPSGVFNVTRTYCVGPQRWLAGQQCWYELRPPGVLP